MNDPHLVTYPAPDLGPTQHDPEELVHYRFMCSQHRRRPQRDCSMCRAASQVHDQHQTAREQNRKYIELRDRLASLGGFKRGQE